MASPSDIEEHRNDDPRIAEVIDQVRTQVTDRADILDYAHDAAQRFIEVRRLYDSDDNGVSEVTAVTDALSQQFPELAEQVILQWPFVVGLITLHTQPGLRISKTAAIAFGQEVDNFATTWTEAKHLAGR